MPREQGRRIQAHDLTIGTANKQGEVHAVTNVKAKTDNINYNAIGQFATDVIETRQKKKNELISQRAIRDTHAGEIDIEMMDDQVYASTVNLTKGSNDSIKVLSQMQEFMQERFQEYKDEGRLDEFNPEEVAAELVQSFKHSGTDNPDYLKGFNSKLHLVQSTAQQSYEQLIAQAEDEEALFTATDTVNTTLSAIKGSSEDKQGALSILNAQLGNDLGLNRDEAHQTFYSSAMHSIQMGDLESAKAVRDFLVNQGSAVSGKYKAKMDLAIKAEEERQKAESLKKLERTDLEKFQLRRGLESTVGTDDFSVTAIEEAIVGEYITDDQGLALLRSHKSAMEKNRLQADFDAEIQRLMLNPDEVPYITNPKIRTAVFTKMDARFSALGTDMLSVARGFINAENTGDTVKQEQYESALLQRVQQFKPLLEASKKAGHTPKALTQVLDSAQLGTPQFKAVASMVKLFEAEHGSTPFQDVDTQKLADIQSYNSLVEDFQYTPEEAERIITEARDNPDKHVMPTLFTSEGRVQFNSRIDDLLGEKTMIQRSWLKNDTETDIQASPEMREKVKEMAVIYHRRGIPAEKAMEMATGRFLETHAPVAGSWLSTKHMPEAFPQAFETFISKAMPQIAENDDLIIRPLNNAKGEFSVMQRSTGKFLRDKEGRIVTRSYMDIVEVVDMYKDIEKVATVAGNKLRNLTMSKAQKERPKRMQKLIELEEQLAKYSYGNQF